MITIRSLRKQLGRRQILQGIDLEIQRGQRVALVGSNGAGKTTLIRCLLGEYSCSGQILIDGVDPRHRRTEVLRTIGFVPQLPPPLKMPVGQLIRYVAALCEVDTRQIVSVAGRLGFDIELYRHQPFVRLSGGQKQKLLIANALGRDAATLILDEPAANLDPEARGIFFELLAERQDDTVMLISSHRLDEVATLVNRVIELDQGRTVLDDLVADSVALTSRLACEIRLTRPEQAFAKAVTAWGFQHGEAGRMWLGTVAGADRLRFLGMLSRYAGLIETLELRETGATASAAQRELVYEYPHSINRP
jgi:ABC-2 type transport system ATP-binding protein